MKNYQILALSKVFLLYIVALLPTWIVLLKKNIYENKKIFLKITLLLTLLEIIIFSIIYFFPSIIIPFFSSKTNIQNYMMYSFKILFIASITTVFQYLVLLYFFKKNIKLSLLLFLTKIFYIPIIIIAYIIFNTKGALFSVPLCDVLYTLLLIYLYKKSDV